MAPTATGPIAASGLTGNANGNTALPGSLEEATARYTSIKGALRTGLAQKRTIDRSLIDLESQIYLFEGSYLQSTASSGGNIVKGFDSYLKNSSSSNSAFGVGAYGSGSGMKRGGAAAAAAAEAAILDIPLEDRIFSLSSATYAKSLEAKANETMMVTSDNPDDDDEDERQPVSLSKKSKKEKEASHAPSTGTEGKPKKKKEHSKTDASGTPSGDARKERERSSHAEGSAHSTPSKSASFGITAGNESKGSLSKLKRKNTDGSTAAASTGGKASSKRKKDDD